RQARYSSAPPLKGARLPVGRIPTRAFSRVGTSSRKIWRTTRLTRSSVTRAPGVQSTSTANVVDPRGDVRMAETKTILVAGAAGQQGGAVARSLMQRGHRVIGLTRSTSKFKAIGAARNRGGQGGTQNRPW